MTPAPSERAMAVPAVPAVGKKVVPGMMNEPQPMQQPNANAHNVNEVNLRCSNRKTSLRGKLRG